MCRIYAGANQIKGINEYSIQNYVSLRPHSSPCVRTLSSLPKREALVNYENYKSCEEKDIQEVKFQSKVPRLRFLGMNHLLHLRVYPDHPLVQIGMVPHQNVWIPCRRDEDRIHTTSNGCHEYLTDLQPD